MRATDGLQTTITVSPVKDNGQALSLELSLVEFRGHQSSSGPGGPRGLLPWGSHGSVRALSGIRLFIS